ncbi:KR domain-containing protein [Sesbania bispinosa]|nr:KR domain-containing protein [Sesbania bispinosa]
MIASTSINPWQTVSEMEFRIAPQAFPRIRERSWSGFPCQESARVLEFQHNWGPHAIWRSTLIAWSKPRW